MDPRPPSVGSGELTKRAAPRSDGESCHAFDHRGCAASNARLDRLDPASLEVLPPGVQFYRWLVAEKAALDHAKRIVCRRAMKALSPRLMKEFLARKG